MVSGLEEIRIMGLTVAMTCGRMGVLRPRSKWIEEQRCFLITQYAVIPKPYRLGWHSIRCCLGLSTQVATSLFATHDRAFYFAKKIGQVCTLASFAPPPL
jgi:hypothetical protein